MTPSPNRRSPRRLGGTSKFPGVRNGGLLAVAAALLLVPAARHATTGVTPVGGAVASAAPAATEVGLDLLRSGGNAADAAVGTALALAVVHPAAGNLGGGGFAVVRIGGQLAALDFRETAPAAATPGMFLGAGGKPVPERSLVGPLAAGVPGSPAGLFELHRRFGRLPWSQVVAPAARLAERGFEVTPRLHGAIAASRALLDRFRAAAAVWLPGGEPPAVGSRMTVPALARTLSAYAEHGPAAVTGGPAAAAIEAASRRAGGILTAADLAGYRAVWREPLRFAGLGWEVASMPLPSSGGIILAETFGILERLRWGALPRGAADRIHILAEVWRRAYADRFLLGDPATTRAGPAQLLDVAWLDRRAREIDRAKATPSADVRPWPDQGRRESRETTHLSVVDADGNAVSLTTTLNGSFGCGLLVPELGILLNNEMDDFATAPGTPNLYGLVQGEANAVGPGKRILSSMTPTIAWRGGDVIALGSPGGSRIPTATAQVLLGVIVDKDALQAAVDRPRVHHQWRPDELVAEAGALSPETGAELTRLGHTLRATDHVGEVHAARRTASGVLEAAADSRGPGAAGVLDRPDD
jgi:gamma-glutamyltranspeptidase / glutathione hydrolase